MANVQDVDIIISQFELQSRYHIHFRLSGKARNLLHYPSYCSTRMTLASNKPRAQSAGAVEYTNCFSAEGLDHHPSQRVSWYDSKPSDGESLALEIWGMPLLLDPLWLGVVASDRVLSMG